jgi:hypothetical protein
MNVTFTCLQAIGIYPYARQTVNMRHRCGARCSIPCCRSANTTSSVLTYLNGLKVPNAHLIFDWLITFLARFQFPLFIVLLHTSRFICPCSLSESSTNLESGKWIPNSSFRVPVSVWVYWPSGSLIVLTLLVAYMTLALPATSAVSCHYLPHGDLLAFLVSLL